MHTNRLSYKMKDFKYFLMAYLGILSKRYAFAGPRRVELHLTNNCNHNCIVCWIRSPYLKSSLSEYHRQELPYDIVLSLIDELHKMGVKIIHISGGGEPLMHPRIWDVLYYIKKKGIACRLNTNFSLIDEECVKKIVAYRLDELMVSVWAGSPANYLKTHPHAKHDTFTNIASKLRSLADLKQKNNQYLPIVNIYNVICNLNYNSIDEMVEFSRSSGARQCIFTIADVIDGQTDIFALSEAQERYVVERLKYWINKYNNSEDSGCFFVGTNSSLSQQIYKNDNVQNEKLHLLCYAGWFFSIIEASGNVSFCCKSTIEPLGNIKKESFRKIWNGKNIRKLRQSAVTGNIDFKRVSLATCQNGCDNIEDNQWARTLLNSKKIWNRKRDCVYF
jgi:MoaA/NifB/PqqE/SkfB family radical SAM enzyme